MNRNVNIGLIVITLLILIGCNRLGEDDSPTPSTEPPKKVNQVLSTIPGGSIVVNLKQTLNNKSTVNIIQKPELGESIAHENGWMIYKAGYTKGTDQMAMEIHSDGNLVLEGSFSISIDEHQALPVCAGAISDLVVLTDVVDASMDLLTNDLLCHPSDALQIQIETAPSNGQVVIDQTQFDYQYIRNFSGLDQFIYSVTSQNIETIDYGIVTIINQHHDQGCTGQAQDDWFDFKINETKHSVELPIFNNDGLCGLYIPKELVIQDQPKSGQIQFDLGSQDTWIALYIPDQPLQKGHIGKDGFSYEFRDGDLKLKAEVMIEFTE